MTSGAESKYGAIDYDAIDVNKVFHDHECHYYDDRFAIVHDLREARRAVAEVESLLGFPLAAGSRVLDAGCGTGFLAAGLRRARPDLDVVGSDLSAGMLSRARTAGAWPLVQADATALPFADGTFDVVAARGVLHHLPDVPGALAEWRRVLAPGGAVVLLSEPTPTVEQHGGVVVKALLGGLRVVGGVAQLPPEEDFWEVASMAANLHVFTTESLGALASAAGFASVRLWTREFSETLLLTASYVLWGRAPRAAKLLPWRLAADVARRADRLVLDRALPPGWRHTVVGVLRD